MADHNRTFTENLAATDTPLTDVDFVDRSLSENLGLRESSNVVGLAILVRVTENLRLRDDMTRQARHELITTTHGHLSRFILSGTELASRRYRR